MLQIVDVPSDLRKQLKNRQMKIKIGINGCGRIGKLLIRILADSDRFEVVVVNDPMPTATLYNLLKFDSLHGRFENIDRATKDSLLINGREIIVYHELKPENIPWGKHGIDCVLEASGQFKTRASLEKHLRDTVKKVVLCQPADGIIDRTIVHGVNENTLQPNDTIISNASCTTNCIAPILKVLNDTFGIDKAFFNTVHPYTNNQSLHDGPHDDPRRSRAALCNIIPTTSSAVEPLKIVMPELSGKIDGFATRVPVPLGSYIEITACLLKKASIENINSAFKKASATYLKGIIEYSEDPLVSTDIIGNRNSAIFDSLTTKVIGDQFAQVLAWYDNETGYSNRVVDLLEIVFKQGKDSKKESPIYGIQNAIKVGFPN
jgi:glyceraldehyde 3-phosphate dehydrogenase